MADAEARFSLVLEDKMSGPAATASQALKKLQSSIDRDKKELAGMQAAMKQLQSGTVVNVAAFKELQTKIEAQKSKISDSTAKFVELGGSFRKTSESAKDTKGKLASLADEASQLPGPLGQMGAAFKQTVSLLTSASVLSMVVAAAFVALGVAVLGAAAALAKFGIAAGNARRTERLHLEGIQNMRSAYVRHRASAAEVQTAIDGVAASSATSRATIAQYAEVMHRAGLRGANLRTALGAAATKAAVLGDESGRAFTQLAVGAHRSGVGIQRLANDVEARFGRAARGMLLDLDVMSSKLSESWNALFDGVDFEPVLNMFHEITQLFSQNTATGRALKAIVTALFGPMVESASGATPIIKRFFQGMVIAALQVTIGILTVRNWLRRTFGGEGRSSIDGMTVALNLGKVAMFGIAAAAGVALLAVGAVGIAIASPFITIYYLVSRVLMALRAVKNFGRELGAEWRQIGSQLVDGLVNGIKGAANRAVAAISEFGQSLVDEWRSILDIHSPSRVFAGLGVQIPRGVEQGIDDGSASLDRTIESMMSIPTVDAGGAATPGARSTAMTITVGDIHIHASETSEPRDLAMAFREQLAEVLEGLGAQIGAPA